MSASTIPRPTENAAIGRAMAAGPRHYSIGLLLTDRATARRNLDRYADHLLGHRLHRALHPRTGER